MTSNNDEDYRDHQLATPTCACFQWREQPPLDSFGCPACAIRTCIAQLTAPRLETVDDMLHRMKDQGIQVHEARQTIHQKTLELRTQLSRYVTQEVERLGQPGRPEAHSEWSSRLPRIDSHEMHQRVLDQISAVKEVQQQYLRMQLNTYLLIHTHLILRLNISTSGIFPESHRQRLLESAEHLRQLDISSQEHIKALEPHLQTVQILMNTPTPQIAYETAVQ